MSSEAPTPYDVALHKLSLLPLGSKVRDTEGDIWEKVGPDKWHMAACILGYGACSSVLHPIDVLSQYAPLQVIGETITI